LVARADGSGARTLAVPPKLFRFVPFQAAFSPDARAVVYFAASRSPVQGDRWVSPVEGGPPRRLTRDEALASDPVWTPDGRWIVFSSQRTGSQTLWRGPRRGGGR